MEGWHRVETLEEWQQVCATSRKEYDTGKFLLDQLGAERYLDPKLMATLWYLRKTIVADSQATTAAEFMLIDMAILAYYNTLRIQGWVGDLALHIEHAFFGKAAPSVQVRLQYGELQGLTAEEHIKRLQEQILPLLDRSNRLVVRNLKALKELRQGPALSVATGKAEQVNVAQQQANAMIKED